MPPNPFTVSIKGLRRLNTLPERMASMYEAAAVITMARVADKVVADAKAQLVPGHGLDTGLLKYTLEKELIRIGEVLGVIYSIKSDAADYWLDVEIGHFMDNGSWWEGYHYIANAINMNKALIKGAAKQAWEMTSGKLAAEEAALLGMFKL